MSPDPRRGITRRTVLTGLGGGLVGTGTLLHLAGTGAFDAANAHRDVNISVADDQSNAFVGLEVYSPVKKNSRDPLVTVANNTGDSVTVTVSLRTCTDGTLYDPQNDTGCSVSYPLAAGNTGRVDIEAAVSNTTVAFDIEVTSTTLDFSATRETTAESGNVAGAVSVKNLNKFSANANKNDWTINKVQVKDEDGDDDLDSVEYEITDSSGTTRATRTDDASGGKYQENKLTITPDDPSYDLQRGETYTLTVTGRDVDGNFDVETAEDTA